jgi:hypothetical protein
VDEDVSFSQQLMEMAPGSRVAKIESRTTLSQSHIWHDTGLIPRRWINTQYVCAEARKETCCYGPREYTRQIKNAQPLERSLASWCPNPVIDLMRAPYCH